MIIVFIITGILVILNMIIMKDLSHTVKILQKDTEFLISISKEFKKESEPVNIENIKEIRAKNAKRQRDRRAKMKQEKEKSSPVSE